MNIKFQSLIPEDFNDHARIWIYQSSREFSAAEIVQVEKCLRDRIKGQELQGSILQSITLLLFGHFIIIILDQPGTERSGFYIDNLIGCINEIERDFQVTLLDRQMLAFIIQDRVQLLPLSMVNDVMEKDMITPETLYFNNTVLTKRELLENWIIPVKDSWLGKRIPNEVEFEL